MMYELELLDHLNDTVTRSTEDTLLLSLLLDYMDGLSCRPEQVSREISENLLQRLGDSLEQDAGALRRLWQSYWVSGRSRALGGSRRCGRRAPRRCARCPTPQSPSGTSPPPPWS